MSCGSCGAFPCDKSCVAPATTPTARKTATTVVRIRISFLPSSFYPYASKLRNPICPRTIVPTACCPRGGRGIRIFQSFRRALPVRARTKETLNGLRDRRTLHRHKRQRLRGCLPRGLHPPPQG